jgi:hypothetical protein
MDVQQADLSPAPLETTRKWLVEYLCEPHSLLGRAGPVCPFVPPALKAGSVLVAERRFGADTGIAEVVAAVFEMVDGFEEADWPDRGASVRALVWVLTGIPEDKFYLLDDAQQATKTELVRQGFILGQFHPHCPETAIRNLQFTVSRAPVPLFGLRQMAFHDVLFLHSDPIWFAAYQGRYGDRYESGGVASHELVSMYRQACRRWNR